MSEEHPERIYGRLQEALHISGYTFEHLCNELKTLLSTDQWRTIGPGYTDFSKFIRTIDLSAFNFDRDERKELIEMMSKAGASNRAIADAVGVASTTIDRNIAANAAPASENTEETSENGAANAAEENESASVPNGTAPKAQTFNEVNDNIGWAKWSWNPVTGCLHNCDYCYARDIANRFYPTKFDPTFYPERLDAPANTKLPQKANGDPQWRRVFTCSMADLFGKWVEQTWIDAIFERIQKHQEWEFLCLTKFPQRLAELDWPANVWAGTTVDRQHRVETAERSFAGVKAGVKWLSCEPLLEPLKFESLAMFDWVVIGASTGSTLVEPFAPPFEWVVDLYLQAKASGCKVYLKHNLFGSEDGRTPGMKPIHEWPR